MAQGEDIGRVSRRGAVRRVVLAAVVGLGLAGGAVYFAMQPRACPDGLVPVTVQGVRFCLEPAFDNDSRVLGLGGRESIDPRGGMIFGFPRDAVRSFLMRDCPIPIDLAFLDGSGRVVALHAMPPEAPRRPDETALMYELRLPTYSSRFPVRWAVEFAGGTFRELGLEEGDVVSFDPESLKGRVR